VPESSPSRLPVAEDTLLLGAAPATPAGPVTPGAPAAPPSSLLTPGEASDPDAPAAAGTRIGGRYEILNLLGFGGMGAVYRVRDRELDEVVALKVLRREMARDVDMLARFRQEVRLARRVTHPNVVRTFDLGEHGELRFITMEYVDGRSLAGILADEGALSLSRALRVARGIAAGMVAAHAASVVHRDLKPDNVLVTKEGRVAITDFGISRAVAESGLTAATGIAVGTPAYMAPEQVEGVSTVDGRADVYAFGALLYEMLTGKRAWGGEHALGVAVARLLQEPPDPRERRKDLPGPLAELVLRCMARDRDVRLPSAELLLAELDGLAEARFPAAPAALGSAAGGLGGAAASRPSTSPGAWAPTPGSPSLAAGRSALRSAVEDAPTLLPPMPTGSARSVAVLPFRNAGEAGDAFLASALTEEIIDTLSMTKNLRVRPLGAVQTAAAQQTDPRALGALLDVQVVIEGSVRRAAAQMRVAVRAISVGDGFQLWARRWDVPASNALSVGDEAARAVAEALTVSVSAPVRVQTSDSAALELFMRGRYELQRRWHVDVRPALELLEQASSRAPDEPAILAACAVAGCRRAFQSEEGFEHHVGRAREAAERAVALAPGLGEAWLALASVRSLTWDLPGAALAARQALRHAPGLPRAQEMMGMILLEAGAIEEALARFQAVLAIDPHATQPRWEMVRIHAYQGDWTRVDALLDLPVEDDGSAIVRHLARGRLGLWRTDNPPPPSPPVFTVPLPSEPMPLKVAKSLHKLRETGSLTDEEAHWLLDIPVRSNPRVTGIATQVGTEVACWRGELERAWTLLETGVRVGLTDIVWMDGCPLLEPMRGDGRWGPLRATVDERARRVREALGLG
jgi:serine/threonine-protein kinase